MPHESHFIEGQGETPIMERVVHSGFHVLWKPLIENHHKGEPFPHECISINDLAQVEKFQLIDCGAWTWHHQV